jgi:hypothetical protein
MLGCVDAAIQPSGNDCSPVDVCTETRCRELDAMLFLLSTENAKNIVRRYSEKPLLVVDGFNPVGSRGKMEG